MKSLQNSFVFGVAMIAGMSGFAVQGVAQQGPPGQGQSPSAVSSSELPKDIDPGSLTRLPLVKREDLDEYGKKVYDAVTISDPRYKDGVPGPLGMWMYDPFLAEHLIPVRNYLRSKTQFDRRLTELAILVTSRELNNQFEWTSHEPGARNAGLEPEIVDIVKYRKDASKLGEKEALIIRFGRELIGDKKLSSDTFARALKMFGKQGVMDLSALMGFYTFIYTTIVTFDAQHSPDQKPLLPPLP